MDHDLDKSVPLMQDGDEREKVVIIAPNNAVGKILIREDTILNNLPGCTGCGRAHFTCAGVKKKWSVLCWGKQSDKKYYSLLVFLSATFAFSLVGAICLCFTNTLSEAILSNMALRNNSLAYSMWKRPSVQPIMRVYVFNYTNWERVRDGLEEKLHVEQVGPYAYSQHIQRVNTKFDGEQLTYQENNDFRYLPEQSVGTNSDQVFVPNLPLLGVVAKSTYMSYFAQLSLRSALSAFADHSEAFLKLPVERFLWGYDDRIIDVAKPLLSLSGQLTFSKFGLLVTKNGTATERLTINTGKNDLDKINIVEKFNGAERMSLWGSPECNSVYSSDGSLFPTSILDRKKTIYVLYTSLCRRFPFKYEKDVKIGDGIQLLRYRLADDVFDDPSRNPSNQCYCEVDTGKCPPRGVINVTACTSGFPAMASFPHFYLADPSVTSDITGLKPHKGNNFIDIHPTLGIALRGKSSLQMNVQIKKGSAFGSLRYLEQDMILPIAWVEMSLENLPESLQSLIYHGTYSTAAAQLGLSIFFILAFIMSAICLIFMVIGRRRKPCAIVQVPVGTEMKSQLS